MVTSIDGSRQASERDAVVFWRGRRVVEVSEVDSRLVVRLAGWLVAGGRGLSGSSRATEN